MKSEATGRGLGFPPNTASKAGHTTVASRSLSPANGNILLWVPNAVAKAKVPAAGSKNSQSLGRHGGESRNISGKWK